MAHSFDIHETYPENKSLLAINKKLFYLLLSTSVIIIVILAVQLTFVSIRNEHGLNANYYYSQKLQNNTLNNIAVESNCQYVTSEYAKDSTMGYRILRFRGDWISGSEILHRVFNNIIIYDFVKKKAQVLFNSTTLYFENYKLSADRNYLLFSFGTQKSFRYSKLSKYIIYNIVTTELVNVTNSDLQQCEWLSNGNGIVYIKNNNIYYRKNLTDSDTQMTFNGQNNTFYNGITDWVYEEEVFGSSKAFWISPNSQRIAYMSFNDSMVGLMLIPNYETLNYLYDLTTDIKQYSNILLLRYPKVNTSNPIVDLYVFDFATNKTLHVPELEEEYSIQSRFLWLNETSFLIIRQNRIQNKAKLVACNFDIINGISCVNISHLEQKNGWLTIEQTIEVIENGTKIFMILSQPEDGDSFNHVVMIDVQENATMTRITQGRFTVKEIVAVNQHNNIVYYLATSVNDPSAKNVYGSNYNTNKNQPVHKCISCIIKGCSYSKAKFSTDFSHLLCHCDGSAIPEDYIITEKTKRDIVVRKMTNNSANLKVNALKNPLPQIQIIQIEIADGLMARVRLQLPPNADLSGAVKYPLLIHVYSGPDSNFVKNSFRVDFNTYLAAKKNVIVAEIDARGSENQGDKLRFSLYKKLGQFEIFDQINITKYLKDNLVYIDKTRTAIWGWSYGGYSSIMSLIKDENNTFHCGVSIAPVTDWRLYDSIYTERYMDLPVGENLNNYVTSSLLYKIQTAALNATFPANKKLFLAHGTFDDNVHYQQSMQLIKILQLANIDFEFHAYPDEKHSLENVQSHLFSSIENFLAKCFKLTC